MATMLCMQCGTKAEPKTFTPGSISKELWLWLIFLLPGILYSIWRVAARYKGCPACQSKNMIPLASPIAQQFLAQQKPSTGIRGVNLEGNKQD